MLIIFGASGDLTSRKLIPAIYNLFKGGHISKNFCVLGVSRSNMTDEEFRTKAILESPFLQKENSKEDPQTMQAFAEQFHYQDLGSDYDHSYDLLANRIASLNEQHGTSGNYIFLPLHSTESL